MKRKKLSFGDINGELSRDELKNIMAGSGFGADCACFCCTEGSWGPIGTVDPYVDGCEEIGGVGSNIFNCYHGDDSGCTSACNFVHSCYGDYMLGQCP